MDLLDLADAALLGQELEDVPDERLGLGERRARARRASRAARSAGSGGASGARARSRPRPRTRPGRRAPRRPAPGRGRPRGAPRRTRDELPPIRGPQFSLAIRLTSTSAIVSSISRRWSSSSSTLPVTFSEASSVSSTTSRRICSRSLAFSASSSSRFFSSRSFRSVSAAVARLVELDLGLPAGLVEDALPLDLRLLALLAHELAQLAGLLAGLVGLVERLADAVAPLVEHRLDPPEREAPEDPEDDQEREDRPDHQARDDVDERALALLRGGGRLLREDERLEQRVLHRHQTSTKASRPPRSA